MVHAAFLPQKAGASFWSTVNGTKRNADQGESPYLLGFLSFLPRKYIVARYACDTSCVRKLILQNMSQASGEKTTRQGQGGGPKTVAGKKRQIAARISNGVHFQSPVLPNGIESQAAWDAHLAGLEEALQPVGAWEKLCVYRIALSAWKHFRLVRHELALVAAAICTPDNGSSDDEDYIRNDDVAEVLRRSESSLEEELFQMRDFVKRVSALAGDELEGISFTAAERRQILSEIIQQSSYDDDEDGDDADDTSELADAVDDGTGHDGEDTNDETADNEDAVIIPAQLREEIEQIAKAKSVNTREAIEELADTLEVGIKKRQRRLQLARTHIGACLIPDERNVNRLALYERQLDAVSRRYLNDLYRAQALRRGEPVAAPIAVDVNVTGEPGNGLH
jgi:hypothetical protein